LTTACQVKNVVVGQEPGIICFQTICSRDLPVEVAETLKDYSSLSRIKGILLSEDGFAETVSLEMQSLQLALTCLLENDENGNGRDEALVR